MQLCKSAGGKGARTLVCRPCRKPAPASPGAARRSQDPSQLLVLVVGLSAKSAK